nr:cytochrome P450 82C4-like [Ipomoea batatas]
MVLDFPNFLAIFCFFFALLYISWRSKVFTKKKTLPPEVDGARPILGHLRLLGRGDIPLGRKLAAMADKYGAVFTLRLGMYRILVVSSWEAVKDCFTTNDKVMAARPDFAVGKYLGYNYAVFSLDTDSPYWRKMRKFAVTELLSSQKLEKLKHLRVSEVETSLKELYMLSAKTVDMNEWFRQLTLNLIVKIVAGKRFKFKVKEDDDCDEYKEAQHIIEVFKEFMYLNGQFVFGDAFPFWIVRWVEFQRRVVKDMGRIMKELDTILQRWVDEHVDARRKRSPAAGNDHQDFIDVMLSMIDDDFARGLAYPPEIIIKATGLSMIIDGSDTTAVHLTWVLSLIVNHPDTMKRIRDDIDSKVGKQRWVEDGDIKDMEYLQAVVKETLRLYPPLPTYAPHAATEDCKVGGYDIPKGTHLYVNAWKVHRDPRIWAEPDRFMPERFLTAAPADAPWRNFEYIPFGGGRRSCIGNTYAMQVSHLTVARLIQGFDFETPGRKALDMSEGLGITLPRATPLDVVITPRLPPSFYGL